MSVKNVLEGDLSIIAIDDRIEMRSIDLEKIITALSVQPELNKTHVEMRASINRIITDVTNILYESKQNKRYSLSRILDVCTKFTDVTPGWHKNGVFHIGLPATVAEVKGKWRNRGLVEGRQRFSYFARKFTKKSLTVIGQFLDGRDHSTVVHSIHSFNDLMDTDFEYKAKTKEIEEIIVKGKL